MKLSIIIPAFNEEKTIAAILRRVLAEKFPADWKKEIITVNDGSSDRTEEAISPFREEIKYLRHETNLGKGAAVKSALEAATGEAVIIQDADLEYDPADIPALIRKFENSGADAVFGSRNINPEKRGYSLYVLGVATLTALINILYGSKLTDIYTGYKLIRTPVLKSLGLESRGFEFEAEVTAKLLTQRAKIEEIPISYQPRKFHEGKKIRASDGLCGLWTILRIFTRSSREAA